MCRTARNMVVGRREIDVAANVLPARREYLGRDDAVRTSLAERLGGERAVARGSPIAAAAENGAFRRIGGTSDDMAGGNLVTGFDADLERGALYTSDAPESVDPSE